MDLATVIAALAMDCSNAGLFCCPVSIGTEEPRFHGKLVLVPLRKHFCQRRTTQ